MFLSGRASSLVSAPVLNPPPILAVKAQLLLDFLLLSQTSSQTYGALATLLHARPTHATLTISLSTLEERYLWSSPRQSLHVMLMMSHPHQYPSLFYCSLHLSSSCMRSSCNHAQVSLLAPSCRPSNLHSASLCTPRVEIKGARGRQINKSIYLRAQNAKRPLLGNGTPVHPALRCLCPRLV